MYSGKKTICLHRLNEGSNLKFTDDYLISTYGNLCYNNSINDDILNNESVRNLINKNCFHSLYKISHYSNKC